VRLKPPLQIAQLAHVRSMVGHIRGLLPGELAVFTLQFRYFRLKAEMLGGPVFFHAAIVVPPAAAATYSVLALGVDRRAQ
jgi:hypothetical protein